MNVSRGQLCNDDLSVFFLPEHGFQIARYHPSDGPRQKRLCVRVAENDIVLMIFWDIPHFNRRILEHEQNQTNGLKEGFTRRVVPCLCTIGLVLGLGQLVIHPRSLRATYDSPQNWLYEVTQQGGLSLLFDCAVQVNAVMGMLSKSVDVNWNVAFRVIEQQASGKELGSVKSISWSLLSDLMAMFMEYLSLDELKGFSLVNSTANRLAQRRIWTAFTMTWDENEPESHLDQQLNALLIDPARTGFIKTLSIYSGWSWTTERLEQFRIILQLLPNLERLSLNQLPPNILRVRTVGNEFGPLLRLINEIQPPFKLEHFKLVEEFRRPTPLFEFLSAQPSIKTLEGCILRFALKNGIPSNMLPHLETLYVYGIHGGVWGKGRKIRRLILSIPDSMQSRGSEEILGRVLNDIGPSAKHLESVTFGAGSYVWSNGLTSLKSMQYLRTLCLEEYSLSIMLEPYSPAGRVISGLSFLQELEFGKMVRSYPWCSEAEEELRCLNLVCGIFQPDLMYDQYLAALIPWSPPRRAIMLVRSCKVALMG
ncbi:hypothetical protein DL93DRAFT_2094944 [Clavulina sp. PMI_390]|nr:hypothetical protein DL93DRAFT_2094944 [Clavulina sp. PMI_390]